MVESGTHESVKFSGQSPQQQWSVSYWQSWAPAGVTQRWPGEGGRGGHSGWILGKEITPSKMDVAPWDKHWIKREFDG